MSLIHVLHSHACMALAMNTQSHIYVQVASFIAWKRMATGEKEPKPAPTLMAYALTQSFSHASHQISHDSSPPIAANMTTGWLQCCNHLGPHLEVWLAQWYTYSYIILFSQGILILLSKYAWTNTVHYIMCILTWPLNDVHLSKHT